MKHSGRWLLALALLLLAAYVLRVFRLDAQSLWWDEGISLHLATSSVAAIVADRLANIHPPIYFFVLKGWTALAGVSPFAARYLSVMAGLLQVALVWAGVRVWRREAELSGGPTLPRVHRGARWLPWLAAGLMAVSPLSVIYSQEIRVYALLPVVYLALLLLAHRWQAKPNGATATGARRWLTPLMLGATAWLALHLHYTAVLAVAYVALWLVWRPLRRRDWAAAGGVVAVFGLVAVASLPWFVAVLANAAAVRAEANAGTFTTEPVTFGYLLAQVWAFQLTGLAGALAHPFVRVASAVVAVVAGALLLLTAATAVSRGAPPRRAVVTLQLAAHWAVPLLGALLLWSVRSFSHPRYVIMFAALLIPLLAFLMLPAPSRPRQAASLMLAGPLVALSLWGLGRHFFEPGKPDVRGVAEYLDAHAAAGDLVIVPDTDWSLPFEYRGPATLLMPQADESPQAAGGALGRALDCAAAPCATSGRVFVLDYPGGTRDWQGRVPFELARRGYRVATTPFDDVLLHEYQLAQQPGPLPFCEAPEVAVTSSPRFGPLRLAGVWTAPDAAADTAVAVVLCWRVDETTSHDHAVSLLLRDPVTGETIAQADTRLLDGRGAPTSQWPAGSEVLTYHVLPVPPGTPPLTLALLGGVYTGTAGDIRPVEATGDAGTLLGQLLPLGEIALSPPVGLAESPYGVAEPPLWDSPEPLAKGLSLVGAQVPSGLYRPGQTIRVALSWRGDGGLPDVRPTLALSRDGATLVENRDAPAQGRYPTDHWPAGALVTEVRDLRLPAGAVGTAMLILSLGEQSIQLGEVTIEGESLLFEPPVGVTTVGAQFGDSIALYGFEPPATLDPAQPVPVTLHWQALTGDVAQGYTVFVHLVAEDGRPIAQHDGLPAGGERPTNEWLAGEYVADRHELIWREPDAAPARLIAGLYDPATGERLRTAEGADHVVLMTFP